MSRPDPREVARLLGENKTLTEIAALLEGPDDGPSPEELAHANASSATRTGGLPPGAEPPVDAPTAMLETFNRAMDGGAGRENATAMGLQVLINEAVKGNPTCVSTGDHNNDAYWRRHFARQGAMAEQVELNRQAARDQRHANAALAHGGYTEYR